MISLSNLLKEQTKREGISYRKYSYPDLYESLCEKVDYIAEKLVTDIRNDIDNEYGYIHIKPSYKHELCTDEKRVDIPLLIKDYAKEKITDTLTSAGYTDFRVKVRKNEYTRQIANHVRRGANIKPYKEILVSAYSIEIVCTLSSKKSPTQ